MTASAGAWYRVGTVNVTKNFQTVTGVATNWQNDVIAIAVGDIFTLDAKTWYEVTAVASDTSITLDRGFEGATGAGQSYAIVRNTSGTILTRIAGQVSVQFNQKQLFLDELRTWLNSNSASETLTDSHGITQSLKTPSQMVRDHDNRLAELDEIHPFPWAMRKVEFEANRAQNNEMFAASGFAHFGKVYGVWGTKVSEGLYSPAVSAGYKNRVLIGSNGGDPKGNSKSKLPTINISGNITELVYISSSNRDLINNIMLPPAEDGTRTYDSSTGLSVNHATAAIAFASETETNKVVTERVDMWGFEGFLREINDADPYVYVNGLIQSQATDMDGVSTTLDNSRPITYFSWYEGDTESRGKGINWLTESDTNRRKIAANPKNNIYFDDDKGRFYQWCVRGRSFAGPGNGDWGYLESSMPFAGFNALNRLGVNGNRDSSPGFSPSASSTYNSGSNAISHSPENHGLGVFSNKYTTFSVDGSGCYFLVCGTVNRLNQGAYHPSFNPLGAKFWANTANGGGAYWYVANSQSASANKALCFNQVDSNVTGQIGARKNSGFVGDASGRPDGKFYDFAYASGHGGVCRDMRYSAWGLESKDFSQADADVKAGKYRGFVNTHITAIVDLKQYWARDSDRFSLELAGEGFPDNQEYNPPVKGYAVNKATKQVLPFNVVRLMLRSTDGLHDFVYSEGDFRHSVLGSGSWYLVLPKRVLPSVSHDFYHTEVIGDPQNILLCNDLKQGWEGSWNPAIPDGASKEFKFTRKNLSSGSIGINTDNNGGDWVSSGFAYDTTKNSHTYPFTSSRVRILQYTTKANLTKTNSISAIYGGASGIGGVYATSYFNVDRGALLMWSLIGEVLTDSKVSNITGGSKLIDNKLSGASGKLDPAQWGYPKHHTLTLVAPENESKACKALGYNVEEFGQGFINYSYTELNHNGGDWGDDGLVHIENTPLLRMDTNGVNTKAGTARIVEPIGWIKNDK